LYNCYEFFIQLSLSYYLEYEVVPCSQICILQPTEEACPCALLEWIAVNIQRRCLFVSVVSLYLCSVMISAKHTHTHTHETIDRKIAASGKFKSLYILKKIKSSAQINK
jgi:hypothetical protein